jgi:hypothetical protein
MSLDITDFSFLRTNALFSNTKSGSCRYYSEFRDKPAREGLMRAVFVFFLASNEFRAQGPRVSKKGGM